jgi:hypothetical protein
VAQLKAGLVNLAKILTGKGKGHPQQAIVMAQGVRVGSGPGILNIRHYKGGRSSALRTGRLYPRRNPWYSFLEAESTPRHMVLPVAPTKTPATDATEIRSRDRSTSSTVP